MKNPVDPYFPGIISEIDPHTFKFKVKIALQGRDGCIEGDMILNSDVLTTQDNRTLKLTEISRINVLKWEKKSRMSKHIFYASSYEIFFRDYRKVTVNGNIESLNKLKIMSNKSAYIYLYFYDFLQNGKWYNCGASKLDAFSGKPADGCAISIELIL